MNGDKLYDGHDEATGLHDSAYFCTELEREISELKRSGRSNQLIVLTLSPDTPVETVREVAGWWKEQFIRVCRYEKKRPEYMLMGLDESDNALERMQRLSAEMQENYPGLKAEISSVEIDGDSGSLDNLAEMLSE